MKPFYSLVAFVFFANFGVGQSKITGSILDEKMSPMEFVPVMLKMGKDSTGVKGAISNDQGMFEFENIPSGSYFTEVSYLGYNTFYSTVFDYDGKY